MNSNEMFSTIKIYNPPRLDKNAIEKEKYLLTTLIYNPPRLDKN